MSLSGANKTVLITGVAGFLGRYAARHFSQSGWKVIGLDILPQENAPMESLAHYKRMMLPGSGINEILGSFHPDVCIHCAGRAAVSLSVTDPTTDFQSGPLLVFDILNALRQQAPACRFVFLSSAAVYGNPTALPIREEQSPSPLSPYGYHKWQSELICQEFSQIYGLRTASVRIFSAYGPGLHRQVIWDICQKALVQKKLKLYGTGQETRDFIHALDIASALKLIATEAPMEGDVYNLASGRQVSISELAHKLLDALGLECDIAFDGKVPLGTPSNWQADISRIAELGFVQKINLDSGLKINAEWCRAELMPIMNGI
jgi:UDP-glucose 4-epimerase